MHYQNINSVQIWKISYNNESISNILQLKSYMLKGNKADKFVHDFMLMYT